MNYRKRAAFAAAIVGLAMLVPAMLASARQAQVGDQAPKFTIRTFDHRTIKLEDLKGKVVLLNYWATWCVPCRQEMRCSTR